MAKYHVREDGTVGACRVTTGTCPFGAWEEHFPSKGEALEAAEALMATRHAAKKLYSFPAKQVEELRAQVAALPASPSPQALRAVGEAFDKLCAKHLPPELWTASPPSREALKEAAAVTQAALAALTPCDPPQGVALQGKEAAALSQAVSCLPAGAHRLLLKCPVYVTTLHGRTTSRGGSHKHGWRDSLESHPVVSPFEAHRLPPGTQVGDVFLDCPAWESDLQSRYYALRCFQLREDGQVNELWLGEKPPRTKGESYRKFSQEEEVRVRLATGKVVTLQKPLYTVHRKAYGLATTLELPKRIGGQEEYFRAVALHEYSHAVQYGLGRRQGVALGAPVQEEEAWQELAGPPEHSSTYGGKYASGFPDAYMGAASHKELFPVASEAFFYPQTPGRCLFYGGERHPQADGLRRWTAGYWLYLAREGEALGRRGAEAGPEGSS